LDFAPEQERHARRHCPISRLRGLGFPEHTKLERLQIFIIIAKDFGIIAAAVDALKKNAFDVIVKSFEQVEFNHTIHTSRPDNDIGSHGAAAKMIKRCMHRQ
jgi:DNA-binding NtrC family response regulator